MATLAGSPYSDRRSWLALVVAVALLALVAATPALLPTGQQVAVSDPGSAAGPLVAAPTASLSEGSETASALPEASRERVLRSYGKLPLAFVPNRGQTDQSVRYLARGSDFSFFFTKQKAVLAFEKGKRDVALDLRFVGASPSARLEALAPRAGRVNHIAAEGRTSLSTYGAVAYRDLWPGIDMLFRGRGGELKYEFRLRAGADPSDIRLAYGGASGLSTGASGSLLIDTGAGVLRDAAPSAYQRTGGNTKPVDVRYAVAGSGYGFEVGRGYEAGRPLVIDPSLAYSTYLGGSGDSDIVQAIAVDASGSAHVTGTTDSPDFPVGGTAEVPFQPDLNGDSDVFVTQLSPSGNNLVYSTYLGGGGYDSAHAIAVDSSGWTYLTGYTTSSNFPTLNGDNTPNGGSDAFAVKLFPYASSMIFSTYLGGSSNDYGRGIEFDQSGFAYVAGATSSSDFSFPTEAGAYDTTHNGGVDGFVTKLVEDSEGTYIPEWFSYLGGSGNDQPFGRIDVDTDDSVRLAGSTTSTNFPTGSIMGSTVDTSLGGSQDAFVTRLAPNAAGLDYSTYLGGSASDSASGGVVVDPAQNAYVAGQTHSTDFPTTSGAYDETHNGASDAFVTKLALWGATTSSTFLGGAGADDSYGVAIDSSGSAYTVGSTNSNNFPVSPDAFDSTWNGPCCNISDAFVAKLDSTLSNRVYATYLGGGADDGAFGGVAVDSFGSAYVAGQAWSRSNPPGGAFPTTTGAWDQTSTSVDGFVSKFTFTPDLLAVELADAPDPITIGETLTYTATVQNNTTTAATGVTLADDLPSEVTYLSATSSQGSCSQDAGTVTCNLGTIAAGGDATVEIEVDATIDGTVANSVSVSASQTDQTPGNNSASVTTTVNGDDTVSEEVPPSGGTVRTGTTPTAADPIVTLLTLPTGGTVTISEHPQTQPLPPGYSGLGWQGDIDIQPPPVVSPDNPIVITFRADASLIPPDPQNVRVFKDGQIVPFCTGPPGHAVPDPCVAYMRPIANGDGEAVVYTTSASAWNLGFSHAYARPLGAAQLRVPLAIAYRECAPGSANRSHAGGIDDASCNPAVQESDWLTVGTLDANSFGTASNGSVQLTMCPNGTTAAGICSTPAAMTAPDVRIQAAISDVRCRVGTGGGQPDCEGGTYSDYTDELQLALDLRVTDKHNSTSPGGTGDPATVEDLPFDVTIPCTPNPAGATPTTVGASCAVLTSANAVAGGSVLGGKRAIWEVEQVEVLDGGPDGDAETADNSAFARQGVFVP